MIIVQYVPTNQLQAILHEHRIQDKQILAVCPCTLTPVLRTSDYSVSVYTVVLQDGE